MTKRITSADTIYISDFAPLGNIQNNTDPTKEFRLDLSGITTGTVRTIIAPDSDGIIVYNDFAATIKNKILDNTNAATFLDTNLTIQAVGDPSKQVLYDLSGLTTATTRTYVMPDFNGTVSLENAPGAISNKTFDFKVLTLINTSGPTADNQMILCDTSSSILTVTLSTADVIAGRLLIIKDTGGNAGTLNITIDTEGAELIEGLATYTIGANDGIITLFSDGVNWFESIPTVPLLDTAIANDSYVATGPGAAEWKQISPINQVSINSAADFPAAGGGVITLADNTAYRLAGAISIGSDRILMGANTSLEGTSPFFDTLTSTNAGAIITCTSTNNTIQSIGFVCSSGSWLDLNGTGIETVVCSKCVVFACNTIGAVDDVLTVILDVCQVNNATSGGWVITGTLNGSFKVTDGKYTVTTGPIFDFGTALLDRIFFVNVVLENRASVVSSLIATPGAGYDVADTVTLTGGIAATQAILTVATVVPVNAQTATNYDGTGTNGTFVGGDGVGALFYVAADVLTMSDGTEVTVNTIDGNNDVLTFTVDSSTSTGALASGATLTQTGNAGTGDDTNFTLTLGDANQGIWAVTVTNVGLYSKLPANPVSQGSTSGLGAGATFTLTNLVETGLDFAASNANLNTEGFAYITDNYFINSTNASVGYEQGDVGFIVRGNHGMIDNVDHAQGYIENSALNTAFTGTGGGNEELVNFGAAFIQSIQKGISISTAGRFTFDNLVPGTFIVHASIFAIIVGGTSRQYSLIWAKNGTLIPSSVSSTELDGTNPSSFDARCIVQLSQGDYMELWVRADTATTSLNVDTCSIQVSQLGV